MRILVLILCATLAAAETGESGGSGGSGSGPSSGAAATIQGAVGSIAILLAKFRATFQEFVGAEKQLEAMNKVITGNKTEIYRKMETRKANLGLSISFFQVTVMVIYVVVVSIIAIVKRVKKGNEAQMEQQFEMIQKRLEEKMNERDSRPRRQKSEGKVPQSGSLA